MRHLVYSHRLTIGSRVLDIGSNHESFVRFFESLGIEAVGWDFGEGDDPSSETFDLVLVRDSLRDRGSLFSEGSAGAAAERLSRLKPGGQLVYFEQRTPRSFGDIEGHAVDCCTRLLSRFPGNVTTRDFPSGLFSKSSRRWMMGLAPRSGLFTVSLRTPQRSLMRAHWSALAEKIAKTPLGSCCHWAASEVQHDSVRRAA